MIQPLRITLVAVLLAACASDPVHDRQVDDLGPEAPGVDPGPLHRPNQPCLVCHGGDGPGESTFSVAGTVWKAKDAMDPLPGAYVRLLDSKGKRYATATNCAGNFFVDPHDFDPAFPMWVTIQYGGIDVHMSTPVFRDGSCAGCHRTPAGEDSVGHVYFAPTTIPFPPSSCP